MKLRAAVLTLILLLSTNWPSAGASRFSTVDELKSEAERAFGQALDLWRDGQFAQLYERTKGGRETREAFARRLVAAPLKPACCWEKMQEVSVRLDGDSIAIVKAKLGFEGRGDTEYQTGSFRLVREDDVWLLSRSDIFSLAGSRKGKSSR